MDKGKPWLSEKNIIIIGGSSGIGWSAAQAFLKEGARVVSMGLISGIPGEQQETVSSHIRLIEGDARNPDAAKEAVRICEKEFGPCHGFYHVAGGSGRKFGDGPISELSLEGWNQTLELNLTSLMLTNQAAIQYFLSRETGGSILNTGSVLGQFPSPRFFSTHAYTAAKSAITGFSKALAATYARYNIRVNVITPGLIETPMAARAANDPNILSYIKSKQPLDGGRIGKPGDLDGLAVYFMSDHSRFVTGQIIAVDGGWSVSEGYSGGDS